MSKKQCDSCSGTGRVAGAVDAACGGSGEDMSKPVAKPAKSVQEALAEGPAAAPVRKGKKSK